MSADEFIWKPDVGTSKEVTHNRLENNFGDGYSQGIRNGINTRSYKQQLTFTRKAEEIDAIEAFLDERAGVTSFTWTPPRGEQCKWVSDPYTSIPLGGDAFRLTVTFRQVYR